MNYSLRPATALDLVPMMQIGHEGLRPYIEAIRGWDQEAEAAGFKAHFVPELIKIIQVNGRDMGYIKTVEQENQITIDGIYLSKEARSAGLGTQVLEDLNNSTGKALQLRVYKINPAFRLYARLGFEVIDEDDHAYIMRCEVKR